jgi:aspartyl-tRNA(Asn)/glutamyl-tRNA(Gln) amidotransferase subunit C
MNIEDVDKLAELAKIELTETEKASLLSDMKGILDYVKVIESVEAEEIPGNYRLSNVWREDKIEPRDFSKELIVKQFPESQDGFLKVKKIL